MLFNLSPVIARGADDIIFALDKGLSIKGTVKQKNTPIPCRVRLFEKLSGRMIADVLTDNAGNYVFNHLTQAKFFLIAHHPQNQFNAVIQDNVVPK